MLDQYSIFIFPLFDSVYAILLVCIFIIGAKQPNLRWLSLILLFMWIIGRTVYETFYESVFLVWGWSYFTFYIGFYLISMYMVLNRYTISQRITANFRLRDDGSPSSAVARVLMPNQYELKVYQEEFRLITMYKWLSFVFLLALIQYPVSYGYKHPESIFHAFAEINSWLFAGQEHALWYFMENAKPLFSIIELLILLMICIRGIREARK